MRQRYGLTQTDVARAAGLSQPALSSIEQGGAASREMVERVRSAIAGMVSPRRQLAAHREQLLGALNRAGITQVQVFGSVARGVDGPQSDVDLLVRAPEHMGLAFYRVADEPEAILGVPVDLVDDDGSGSRTLVRARAEAIPL